MLKKRVMGVMLSLFMAVSVMGTTTMQVSAAGCSNWQIYSTSASYCKDESCGFLWLNPQTNYQTKYYKRTCVSNSGKVTTEYKNSLEKLGCC